MTPEHRVRQWLEFHLNFRVSSTDFIRGGLDVARSGALITEEEYQDFKDQLEKRVYDESARHQIRTT